MKVNPLNLMIAVLISAVLAYGLWSFENDLKNYVAVGGFVFFVGTLAPLIAGRYEYVRNSVNLRTICGAFFLIGLVLHCIFALTALSATSYIITSASAFLIYVFLANAIYGAEQ